MSDVDTIVRRIGVRTVRVALKGGTRLQRVVFAHAIAIRMHDDQPLCEYTMRLSYDAVEEAVVDQIPRVHTDGERHA